jgi:chromosome segregation ATPase
MPDDTDAPERKPQNPEIEETRTSIDTLIELLKARGRSELNSVAVALNVDPRIVENWAKVLEAGNLIKISYEVGKMYLEPMNLAPEAQQDLKTKTEVTKFILQEDLAIERISLDKFSKSIEELNESISNVDKIYQRKLPDVQRILAEVDKVYSPLEAKRRGMDKLRDEADKDFQEINRKADTLYSRLNAFSPKQTETKVTERLDQLNKVLDSIDEAQTAINETERNEIKFFKNMQSEIDAQVKELKRQLSSSKTNTEQALRANSRQLNELMKGIKEQAHSAQQISHEVENYRKEFESAKHDLDILKSDFADRHERLKEGMDKDFKIVEMQSKKVTDVANEIKKSLGDVSKFDEDIRRWRKNMSDMAREITTSRTEIMKLSNQLNAVDASKNMTIENKAKTMDNISKESKKAKERENKIRKTIKDTSEELKEMAEGKKSE